jgi:hypothetical protein
MPKVIESQYGSTKRKSSLLKNSAPVKKEKNSNGKIVSKVATPKSKHFLANTAQRR